MHWSSQEPEEWAAEDGMEAVVEWGEEADGEPSSWALFGNEETATEQMSMVESWLSSVYSWRCSWDFGAFDSFGVAPWEPVQTAYVEELGVPCKSGRDCTPECSPWPYPLGCRVFAAAGCGVVSC